jgi:hypothetical protein
MGGGKVTVMAIPGRAVDEHRRRREIVDDATASVRAEGFQTTGEADALAERFADGEFDAHQLVRETNRLHRR